MAGIRNEFAIVVAAFAAVTLFGAVPASSSHAPPQPVPAASEVHRLGPASFLRFSQQGPASSRARGTLSLTPLPQPQADPEILAAFAVSNVNLLFTIDNVEQYVTGSGTYEILSSLGQLPVIGQRMALTLTIGDSATARRFISGDVVFTGELDLSSFDITLVAPASTPSGVATIRIAAESVAPLEITPYLLATPPSQYIEGCFDPCLCPVFNLPLTGSFALVPLPGPTPGDPPEFALIDVRFHVLAPTGLPVQRWIGAGIYQRDTCPFGSPLPSQRLRANLRRSDSAVPGQSVRFDSGCIVAPVPLPTIDVAIADNGFECYNRVFDFVAGPQ